MEPMQPPHMVSLTAEKLQAELQGDSCLGGVCGKAGPLARPLAVLDCAEEGISLLSLSLPISGSLQPVCDK